MNESLLKKKKTKTKTKKQKPAQQINQESGTAEASPQSSAPRVPPGSPEEAPRDPRCGQMAAGSPGAVRGEPRALLCSLFCLSFVSF